MKMISRQAIRRFSTTIMRRSHDDDHGGYPGANIPFSINNRFKLTFIFTAYLGSGFAIPFLLARHQLLKD